MNEIDQVLESLTPDELTALEVEIDVKAGETKSAYHFTVGMKMAREAFAHFQKTGELTPALALVKHSGGQPADVDVILDKCSAEELAQFEKELDAKIALEKSDVDKAGALFEQGRKMAQNYYATHKSGEKTAFLGAIGKGLGALGARMGGGLLTAGLKGGGQGLGQGLLRGAGQLAIRNPRLAGGLATGAAGATLFGAGRASKDGN